MQILDNVYANTVTSVQNSQSAHKGSQKFQRQFKQGRSSLQPNRQNSYLQLKIEQFEAAAPDLPKRSTSLLQGPFTEAVKLDTKQPEMDQMPTEFLVDASPD